VGTGLGSQDRRQDRGNPRPLFIPQGAPDVRCGPCRRQRQSPYFANQGAIFRVTRHLAPSSHRQHISRQSRRPWRPEDGHGAYPCAFNGLQRGQAGNY